MTQDNKRSPDWIKCKICKKGMFLKNFKNHIEKNHPEMLGVVLEPLVIW